MEILADRVDAFRQKWSAACEAQLSRMAAVPPSWAPDVRLDERDDLMAVLADLERLEPCGEANPAPRLLLSGVRVVETREIKGHLKVELEIGQERISGFGPEMGARVDELDGAEVTVVGRLKRDHFRGGEVPEVLLMYVGPP